MCACDATRTPSHGSRSKPPSRANRSWSCLDNDSGVGNNGTLRPCHWTSHIVQTR